MTSKLDSTQTGPSERRHLRSYVWGFGASMAAYVVVLFVAPSAQDLAGSPWQIPLLLAPVVPVGFALAAVVRFIRGLDEYQSSKLFVSLSCGFGIAMFAAVVVGFLDFAFAVPMPSWIIFVTGMLGWSVAAAVTARK